MNWMNVFELWVLIVMNDDDDLDDDLGRSNLDLVDDFDWHNVVEISTVANIVVDDDHIDRRTVDERSNHLDIDDVTTMMMNNVFDDRHVLDLNDVHEPMIVCLFSVLAIEICLFSSHQL